MIICQFVSVNSPLLVPDLILGTMRNPFSEDMTDLIVLQPVRKKGAWEWRLQEIKPKERGITGAVSQHTYSTSFLTTLALKPCCR